MVSRPLLIAGGTAVLSAALVFVSTVGGELGIYWTSVLSGLVGLGVFTLVILVLWLLEMFHDRGR